MSPWNFCFWDDICSDVMYGVMFIQSVTFPSDGFPSWKVKILLKFGLVLRHCLVALNCG